MIQLILMGGPMTWLILASGAFGAVVFLERLLALHRAQIRTGDFLMGIFTILKRQNTVEAVSICEETPGPVPRIVRAAILHHDEGRERILQAVQETGLVEIPYLERRLGFIATLAHITPIMGLLGTVLGMMRVLIRMQGQAPLVHSGDLAGGLWQALIATAVGLAVAILAYTGYNLLVSRVESIVLDMERSAAEIIALLTGAQSPARNGKKD